MKNQRYQEAFRAALLGLGMNLILSLIKFIGGVFSKSSALIADGVNSLGDTFASLAVLYGLRVSLHPPDAEHPYGHTRAEGIAAICVSGLVITTALLLAWESLKLFGQQTPEIRWWAFAIAGGNVLLKEGLYQYNIRVGRRTDSTAIIANAWDHRGDAFCSLAVLLSLSIIHGFGPEYAWVDQLTAILVALGLVTVGIRLFYRSASELMDVQADAELVEQIRVQAMRVEGVREIETLLVRKTGMEFLVDIHIEVLAQLTVEEGHRISHRVKDHLLHQFPELRDVLVHIEPYPHCNFH